MWVPQARNLHLRSDISRSAGSEVSEAEAPRSRVSTGARQAPEARDREPWHGRLCGSAPACAPPANHCPAQRTEQRVAEPRVSQGLGNHHLGDGSTIRVTPDAGFVSDRRRDLCSASPSGTMRVGSPPNIANLPWWHHHHPPHQPPPRPGTALCEVTTTSKVLSDLSGSDNTRSARCQITTRRAGGPH